MIKREKNEAKNCNELILIYPLVPYKRQFWLEDAFHKEANALKKEIE